MEITLKVNKLDPRIVFLEYTNSNGQKEKYIPQRLPNEIFLSLENNSFCFYTSNTNTSNNYFFYLNEIQKNKFVTLSACGALHQQTNFYFYETFCWFADNQKNNNKKSLCLNLQLINYKTNSRLSLITSVVSSLTSITKTFPSMVWPEREIQDMFNIKFLKLLDSRRLLLDYKIVKGVMLPKPINLKVPFYSLATDLYYL